jgi:hypothetical protein
MSHAFNSFSFELLLIAGRAVVLVLAFAMFGWGFIRWRRAAQRDTQRVFEQLDLVRSDLLIMKEVMANAAQRVDSAAQRVVHDARLVAAPAGGNTGRGYEIAARLARNGAQKEELIRTCGITPHEAELLVKLHGRSSQAATKPSLQTPSTQTVQPTAQNKMAQELANIARQAQSTPSPQQPAARAPQKRSRLVAVG